MSGTEIIPKIYGVAYHGYRQVTARICSLFHLPDSRYIKVQNYPSVPENLVHIITNVFPFLSVVFLAVDLADSRPRFYYIYATRLSALLEVTTVRADRVSVYDSNIQDRNLVC